MNARLLSSNTRLLACSLVTLLTVASIANAENWPRFRGPDGAGVASAKGLPIEWSDTDNVTWKVPMPGKGASSPIIYGDKIFVACYSGYGVAKDEGDRSDLKQHILCIDKKSGKILWDKSRKSENRVKGYGGFIKLHGYASSTPACDGEAVYGFFGVNGAIAYDMKGKLLWTKNLGTKTHGFGTANSPVVYENLVIINASVESGTLYALDKKSGKEVWKAPRIRESWNTPLVVKAKSGRTEIVLNTKGKLRAFNPKDGKNLWNCDAINDYICPSVIAHDGVVYAIGGRSRTCVAIDAGGEGDLQPKWRTSAGSNVSSPVYKDGKLYWVSDKGIAISLDTKDGSQVQKRRVGKTGTVYASVLLAGDRLYCISRERGTWVLSADKDMKELAHNKFASDRSIFNGSPAVSEGKMYLRSDKFLYCLADS